MKRAHFMLMIVLSIGCYVSNAQRLVISKKPRPFRAMVWAGNQLNNGFLNSINDTSLQLSPRRLLFTNKETLNAPTAIYYYTDIERMKVWKYGKVSRGFGFGFGAITGMGIGAIIGLINYKKPEPNAFLNLDFGPGFSALTGAFIGSIPGSVIGGILGMKKLKFNINRNKSSFNDMKTVLLEKAF